MNSKHPKEFTIRSLLTDFIKNEIKTVAMAAYPIPSTNEIIDRKLE
jgi:hypothetical protein